MKPFLESLMTFRPHSILSKVIAQILKNIYGETFLKTQKMFPYLITKSPINLFMGFSLPCFSRKVQVS